MDIFWEDVEMLTKRKSWISVWSHKEKAKCSQLPFYHYHNPYLAQDDMTIKQIITNCNTGIANVIKITCIHISSKYIDMLTLQSNESFIKLPVWITKVCTKLIVIKMYEEFVANLYIFWLHYSISVYIHTFYILLLHVTRMLTESVKP